MGSRPFSTSGATGEDLFDYQNYIDFSQRDFATFQEQITQRSYFHASVDWDETDRYLTLSTCDYDINNGRIVVVARALREGETADGVSYTDNTNQRMPNVWYTSRNMDNPFL